MSNCKVIALTNQKGGVGKTTTAVNLGVSLARQGKKVLLIDADAQANLTMSLGYNRPDDLPVTLSTIMQDIIDDNPIDVQKSILHHGEGVDLLPSNIELSGLEVRLINAISRESVLKTCVNKVKKNYDYCLIDCMPSLGMLTINALAAADSVVIPTQPHYLSAKGLELLLRSVSKVRRQINPPLRIDGILMTDEVYQSLKNMIANRPKVKVERIVDGYSGFLMLDKNGNPKVAQHIENEIRGAVKRYQKLHPDSTLPPISPHVYRHTFCTELAAAGIEAKSLQYLMGHATISTTLDTYTHINYERAAEQMAQAVSRERSPEKDLA